MKTILVAGGLNTRFEEYDIFPKILLPYKGNKSLLINSCELLDPSHILINKKYYDMVKNYIQINKLNLIPIATDEPSSYDTIISAYDKLPDEDLLFVWSDLVFTETLKVETDADFCIFVKEGQYRFRADKKVFPVNNNGNVPGVYYIKNKLLLENKRNGRDFVEFLIDKNISTKNLSQDIIEFRDKQTYTDYLKTEENKIVPRFFNKIEIKDNSFIKTAVDSSFNHLIQKEAIWYQNANSKLTPKLLSHSDNHLQIEFLNEYKTLFDYVKETSDFSIITNVNQTLNVLHQDKLDISEQTLYGDIKMEFYDKVIQRINSVRNLIINFDEKKFLSICERSFEFIKQNIKTNEYSFIHGDTNGSNIMIHPKTKDIKLIDPRGYFGFSKLYGLPEYDFAKLNYFLHGYDSFNRNPFLFSSKGFDKPPILKKYFDNKLYDTLTGVIYLCLASYIANNIMKVNISYYYGLELLEKTLEN